MTPEKKSTDTPRHSSNVTKSMVDLTAKIYIRFLCVYAILAFVLRMMLLMHPITDTSTLTIAKYCGIFGLGLVNDICIGTLFCLPLWAFFLSSGRWKFSRPQGYIFLGILVAAWIYVRFGAGWLQEFNKGLHRILGYVMIFWIASFALRLWVKKIRTVWFRIWTYIILGLMLAVMLSNDISEWFFWNEFGVRYNFIAVDYLVYTNEVIGNIFQSYPMVPIIAVMVIATVAMEIELFGKYLANIYLLQEPGWRVKVSAVYLALVAASLCLLPLLSKAQHSSDVFYNELQATGPYSFYQAFMANDLSYNQFYITLPDSELDPEALTANSEQRTANSRPNIILVTMESMSADNMARFGGTKGLTPVLDSISNRGMSFDRMFACGNRTVRGLEALALSRPPSPGESIIKRPDNTSHHSTAAMFDSHGYTKLFFYGGDSYFDNMKPFYTGMGYDIIDRGKFDDSEIEFNTIWGICDEDVFSRVIREMDSRTDASQTAASPVFAQIMTTSNHRPYTYPDGRVSIPPSAKSRDGAVMYSDYAIGAFLREASQHKWFDNTIFVFIADHCASSAGSISLPLENYHIPCVIYSPALIPAGTVTKFASQADVMPTLFAMLGWGTDPELYGRDILADKYRQRAFIATYQDLGYFENDTLTVLSPGRRYKQYLLDPTPDNPLALTPIPQTKDEDLSAPAANHALRRTVTLYQSASN